MNNDIYTLNQKCREGEQGEAFIKENYLNKEFATVIDASKIKRFQHDDIDFIARKEIPINVDKMLTYDNDTIYKYVTTMELKSDQMMHRTGNMFIEDYILVEGKHIPGVLEKCKAQQLLYFDAIKKVLYVVDFNKLKSFIRTNENKIKHLSTTKNVEVFHCNKTGKSYGFLVNVNVARENNLFVDEKWF